MSIHTHGHYAYMSAESYISYCDGKHSTFVQFVLMLSLNHSLAKARLTMCCIHLVGASRSEPHTSALIDFRFACLLVGWFVCAVRTVI